MRTAALAVMYAMFAGSIVSTVVYWPSLTVSLWWLGGSVTIAAAVALVDHLGRNRFREGQVE